MVVGPTNNKEKFMNVKGLIGAMVVSFATIAIVARVPALRSIAGL